jgi:hypothetical protein
MKFSMEKAKLACYGILTLSLLGAAALLEAQSYQMRTYTENLKANVEMLDTKVGELEERAHLLSSEMGPGDEKALNQ